ncbi:MAG: hypothetical protein ABIQ43_09155 [Sphingomonas sp.]
MKALRTLLLVGCSTAMLAGCGADDIASPGAGTVVINNPPAPAPTPTPTPTVGGVVPASACPVINDPQGLRDRGTITGPTGTYRVCALPARLNVTSSLPKTTGVLYNISGRVDVGTDQGPTEDAGDPTDVTLTVNAGAIVFADSGPSWINVNRGNQIQAVGTATQPIIFTSRANIEGINTDNSSGQWGGVVLSGRAPITDCAAPAATPGTIACERQTEGAVDPALYGGATRNDNSGRMSFVQIRYSGFVLSANSELQSLTTQGVGSATILDHIMSFNSSDDGAEFFGGSVNLKYYISVGAEDDNLDTDTGLKGNFQYVIVAQRLNATAAIADSIIEADSDNAVSGNNPRQNVHLANFTFIDRVANNADVASILLRGETDYSMANGILVNTVSNPCLRVSLAQTASTTQNAAIDEFGAPAFNSVVFSGCAAQAFVGANGVTDAQVQGLFTAGTNNNAAITSTLTSLYVNGANETAVPAFDPSTWNGLSFNGITVVPAGFFDRTTYVGAVRDAADTWYQGWTCNSTTATFGAGNSGNCTTIPTT